MNLTAIEQRPLFNEHPPQLLITPAERDWLCAEVKRLTDMLNHSTEERAKLIVQLTDHVPVRDQLNALTARAVAAEQTLGAIESAIAAEYNDGKSKRSGDLLDDFAEWVRHHAEVESERNQLRADLAREREAREKAEADVADLRASLSEALTGTLTLHTIPRGEQAAEVVRLTAELTDTKAAIRAEIAAAFDAMAELFRERQFAVMSLSDCFNNVAAKLRRE